MFGMIWASTAFGGEPCAAADLDAAAWVDHLRRSGVPVARLAVGDPQVEPRLAVLSERVAAQRDADDPVWTASLESAVERPTCRTVLLLLAVDTERVEPKESVVARTVEATCRLLPAAAQGRCAAQPTSWGDLRQRGAFQPPVAAGIDAEVAALQAKVQQEWVAGTLSMAAPAASAGSGRAPQTHWACEIYPSGGTYGVGCVPAAKSDWRVLVASRPPAGTK